MSEPSASAAYSLSEGVRLVRALLSAGRYVFSTDDAAGRRHARRRSGIPLAK